MTLPVVRSSLECADFNKTILPFLPQLHDLLPKFVEGRSSVEQIQSIYLGTNPVITAFAFALFLSPLCFVVSEINKNYSQVDRLWSILPTVYIAHYCTYAHLSGLPTSRLDNYLACSVVWSLRLTFNYWRKGGYKIGSEDYRWEVLREKISATQFFLFNVFFIGLAQNILLFLIATPSYILLLVDSIGTKISRVDNAIPRVLLGLVLIEFFADQQQWNFQGAKQSYLATAKVPYKFDQEDLDRGFVVTGLWSYSRHPNFAAEQAVWIVPYIWSCFASETLFNWSGAGALGYILLFQASTWFTELITTNKYPEYAEYQKRVAKFVPKLLPSLPGDFSDQKAKPKVETRHRIARG